MRGYLALIVFGLWACKGKETFIVNTVASGTIVVDGKADINWQQANVITAFTNPRNKEVSPRTALSLLRDNEYLYFLFAA